ncbi:MULTISPECIES: O-methyltransferase [Pseudoxanthomonas]|uniref:Methyltransferase domain-containing protein n=1 Tax=Pseudoxanthomonas winnipegensis TaxID=2480810 RepID=A0A4Q8L6H3_9GAMM|nr:MULTISPECIES: class I SAM-dependent methyltransferase [Pseudoxanthomonas]PZP60164.1 MAG: methyltransferase [Pseudoxanthomonas spadix]TAA23361.1 methyltransferase domain-containing protein [Pseudoxanthomonas winnipegensis]TMN17222.1 methyltransferase domain-containing protein [Pseudoxanthomonas sp. X-1]UAY76764.1 class I SAM-dependent methyltransferase [Pseudoxanthomonas sp. X-1]
MHDSDALQALKAELFAHGERNDAVQQARGARMLNITPDTGEFLAVLVRATQARRVLEIGTSNGYSTLWLAEAAAAIGGRVTTLEFAPDKWRLAQLTFARSGLAGTIDALQADAGVWLASAGEASVDLMFLDADRDRYLAWWPDLRRVLRPGGTLVVDNAVSHAAELAAFEAGLRADAAFTCALLPVGKGELVAVRAAG